MVAKKQVKYVRGHKSGNRNALQSIISLGWILLTILISSGCSKNFRTIGIINDTDAEITIETRPNIRYNGSLEKSIGLITDTSQRGLVWKVGLIDCIILYPLGQQPAHDSMGKYIMKPQSSFRIGTFYKPTDTVFTNKCLNIHYLKVTTPTDTVSLTDKDAIWKAINYDNKSKRNRKIFYDKAILVR